MALDVLQKEAGVIHLLLTDVVMPEMSGPVLAEKVQNIKPGIKVVFMSGYTNEMIAAHGVLEEGTQFIQKPFTPAGLAKKIRDVLG
jgi:two-component SAPR family response regulator